MQAYSNPQRESDPYSLPDVEVFELTAEEAVQQDEDLMWDAGKQFPLMHMNSRERDKAIEWAIAESGCEGGWYWWSCLPGCMPDSSAIGPFATREEALADAQQDAGEDDDDDDGCYSQACSDGNHVECSDIDANCCDCSCHYKTA